MTKKFRGSMFTGGGGGTHSRQVDDFYATQPEKYLMKLSLKEVF